MADSNKKEQKDKNPNAMALGRLGGKARLQKLSREQRRQIAKKAIEARWAKVKSKGRNPP